MALEAELLLRLLEAPETELMVPTSQNESLYLNNLNQVVWPSPAGSSDTPVLKRHVIAYYAQTLESMTPFIKGQGLMPLLYPNGVEYDYFYPIFHPHQLPSYVHTQIDSDTGKTAIIADNAETLFYLLNLGAISFDCPMNRCLTLQVYAPKKDVPFSSIAACALTAKGVIEKECSRSFIKPFQFTHYALDNPSGSGQSEWQGLDIIVPFYHSSAYRNRLCQEVYEVLSQTYASLGDKGKINLRCQYQQELICAQTLGPTSLENFPSIIETLSEVLSPYSLTASASPLVSAPIHWDELETAQGQPEYWTRQNALKDISQRQQAWDGFNV